MGSLLLASCCSGFLPSAPAEANQPLAGVEIIVEEDRDPVRNGATLRYRVICRNNRDTPVTGLVATASYDPKLSFRTAFPPPAPETTNRWTVGTLEPGQQKRIIIRVRVPRRLPAGSLLRTELSLIEPGGSSIADYEITSVRIGSRRQDP